MKKPKEVFFLDAALAIYFLMAAIENALDIESGNLWRVFGAISCFGVFMLFGTRRMRIIIVSKK